LFSFNSSFLLEQERQGSERNTEIPNRTGFEQIDLPVRVLDYVLKELKQPVGQPILQNAKRLHDFVEIRKFPCLISRFSLFNLEMNGPDAGASKMCMNAI